jgi:hypothetical protein
MSFKVLGLAPDQFRPFFDLSDDQLREIGARRVIADEPGLPCRVSMGHAEVGEEMLLLNFEHQPANTPYRANHAIYVRRAADKAYEAIDAIPEVMAGRLLAVRAFDAENMMFDAEVCEGKQAAEIFERFLANPNSSYLQVHNARRGCYSGRVERV